MLFWIFVIGLLVGIGLIILGGNSCNNEWISYIGACFVVIFVICLTASLIIILIDHADADAKVAEYQERHKALVFKLETEAARDELGLLNKEIIDEIQEWNEDIVYHQKAQDSFWIGIYYPNVYDQFEIIELK